MVSVWISQENALVQNLAPNGTFFAWEMIKKTHYQHKSIKFNFNFIKSFEYSDEWPTNPGISDTPEMHRAKGFFMPLQRCPFLAAIARRKGECVRLFRGGCVWSRWMNLSSVYLRRSGCLYMYTGPILPPAATSAPGTYLAGVSLYSWSVPV